MFLYIYLGSNRLPQIQESLNAADRRITALENGKKMIISMLSKYPGIVRIMSKAL